MTAPSPDPLAALVGKLPELPEAAYVRVEHNMYAGDKPIPYYTADQMRAYAATALDASRVGVPAEVRRWVELAREALPGTDWTAENIERGFCVQDQFGEHTPCNVFMPDGAGLDFNHHAVNGVDQSRAGFVSAACNAMLAMLSAAPGADAGEKG